MWLVRCWMMRLYTACTARLRAYLWCVIGAAVFGASKKTLRWMVVRAFVVGGRCLSFVVDAIGALADRVVTVYGCNAATSLLLGLHGFPPWVGVASGGYRLFHLARLAPR